MRNVLSVLTVVAAMLLIWTAAVIPMNIHEALTQAEREGIAVTPATAAERRGSSALSLVLANPALIPLTYAQPRPKLPSPAQVVLEFYDSAIAEELDGRRGLVRSGSLSPAGLALHTLKTIETTLLGFALGAVVGVALAVGIVYARTMDLAVMPWAIISQTIPIVALAPMIVLILSSLGVTGLVPRAIIAAYLSFFPVLVGMVKGLRAPDHMQLDLMRTYSATKAQSFWMLRLPMAMPYLFASLKIAIAGALVGAIVSELSTSSTQGLGARMLQGSYYGQTVQIWAALLAAALLAAVMVAVVGAADRVVRRMMGGLA
ncbi:ABC transporter permease [Ketogulonicigenium robustum]|uniref:ABC transporter permease n=1 Tax=Ketogulonicigenium robustum TaxID=92947 RepID=UPI000A26D4FB|nr:ABC transporter permease subunit [Ketogulonicigenium robustum]